MLKGKILITRPKNHDATTNYLYYWSEDILKQAKKSERTIIDLKMKRVNLKEFGGIIQKSRPSLIIINGHGDENTVTGYDNQPLVQIGSNESLLVDTITYARSCCAAKKLGPACVKKGTIAFIGYTDEFVFMFEEKFVSKPLNDKTAGLFLKASNQVAISLVKGQSAKEADSRSKNAFGELINKYSTSEATTEESELLPYLYWDMSHQVCLGDNTAKV